MNFGDKWQLEVAILVSRTGDEGERESGRAGERERGREGERERGNWSWCIVDSCTARH